MKYWKVAIRLINLTEKKSLICCKGKYYNITFLSLSFVIFYFTGQENCLWQIVLNFSRFFSRLQTLCLATCFNKRRKTQAWRPQRRIFVCGCLCVGHYCQAIFLFRGLVNALVDPSLPHFSPGLLKFKNSIPRL